MNVLLSFPPLRWLVLETMRLWRDRTKCALGLSSQGIKSGMHLSTGFHSLLIMVAHRHYLTPLHFWAVYVCQQRGSLWMFQAIVSEKQVRVIRCCQFHLHDDSWNLQELLVTYKSWGWEDLECCSRQVLYIRLWWFKEERRPRKVGIELSLRATTTRGSNSIWIFLVLNLCFSLVGHPVFFLLRDSFVDMA